MYIISLNGNMIGYPLEDLDYAIAKANILVAIHGGSAFVYDGETCEIFYETT